MDKPGHQALATSERVVLAHVPPFELSGLKVCPAHRQLEWRGRSKTVEPRVMQVFVALATVPGRILTRDNLTEMCWEGRIVGDDSINRTLSQLRGILTECAATCFTIETIKKVGYRLVDSRAGGLSSHVTHKTTPMASLAGGAFARRSVIGGSIAVAAAGAASVAWLNLSSRSPNAEAMRFYEQGMAFRGQGSAIQAEQSTVYFREAVRADPTFADAWGALSWAYCALLEYGAHPDEEKIRFLARSAAQKALEIDPANISARGALLTLNPNFRNWAKIELGCRNLLAADPRNTVVALNLAFNFCEVGRWREAAVYLREIVKREPLWPLSRVLFAAALFASGNSLEAEDSIEAAMKLWPQNTDLWFTRVRLLILTQRYQEAQRLFSTSQPAGADRRDIELEKALAAALAGGSEITRRSTATTFVEAARRDNVLATNAALVNGLLGFPDAAFEILHGYYFGRGPWRQTHSTRPRTIFLFNESARPLRSDSRFGPLLTELGLEDYWKRTGSQPDFQLRS